MDRVNLFAGFFQHIECRIRNREFMTVTGTYNGKRLTVVSTGIGTDNIDIVVSELDALVNIDLEKRELKKEHTPLRLIRVGTSGSMQPDIPVNSWVLSEKSIGFDGLLNFYEGRNAISDRDFEEAFTHHTLWNELFAKPYVVDCSEALFRKLSGERTVAGINISAPGFYGPQGRILRLPLADPGLNEKVESFSFSGKRITNYEMESSAIYGLAKLLGHEAVTICLIIANRVTLEANERYRPLMKKLIRYVLDKITDSDGKE